VEAVKEQQTELDSLKVKEQQQETVMSEYREALTKQQEAIAKQQEINAELKTEINQLKSRAIIAQR